MSITQLRQPTQCHLWQSENLRPQDVDEALEVIKTLADESHYSMHLRKCRTCGQLYADVWYEIVDWDEGKDQMFSFYIPVQTDAEVEQLKRASPMSLDLLDFFPRINEDRQGGTRKVAWIGKS